MEKEQNRPSRVPDHEGRESQGEREPHLGRFLGKEDQSESHTLVSEREIRVRA